MDTTKSISLGSKVQVINHVGRIGVVVTRMSHMELPGELPKWEIEYPANELGTDKPITGRRSYSERDLTVVA